MLVGYEGQCRAEAEGPTDMNKDVFIGCGPVCIAL